MTRPGTEQTCSEIKPTANISTEHIRQKNTRDRMNGVNNTAANHRWGLLHAWKISSVLISTPKGRGGEVATVFFFLFSYKSVAPLTTGLGIKHHVLHEVLLSLSRDIQGYFTPSSSFPIFCL